MLTILILTLGLAGLFGFLLGIYFFTYRVSLPGLLQWMGGAVGGLFMGAIMIVVTLLMIWPPFNIFFLIVGLVFYCIMTAMILCRKPAGTLQCPVQGGVDHEGVDSYMLDIDAGTGS